MKYIEVGEYIRTKKGYIGKVIKRDIDDHVLLDIEFEGVTHLTKIEEEKNIVKHSTDIKDLIVVGDIVKYRTKGVRIIKLAVIREFLDTRSNKERLIVGGYSPEQIDILEILTKEQYIANCYKV